MKRRARRFALCASIVASESVIESTLGGPDVCRAGLTWQVLQVPCTALVELCCDEDSELGVLAPEYGIDNLRITQNVGFEKASG